MPSLFSSLKATYAFLREAWFLGSPAWTTEDIPDLTGQVFIVTGGNSGLGKDTVRALLEHDARVYIASRDEKRSYEAIEELFEQTGRRAYFLQLDLADLASVKGAAEKFLREEQRLDVLFNNAASLGMPLDVVANGYDMTFHTNLLGPFYFTKLLFPILATTSKRRADGQARIVNLSSSVNHLVDHLDINTFKDGPERRKHDASFFYCQSKFAMIVVSNELSRRYRDEGIVSIAVNPGNFMTPLQKHAAKNWVEMAILNYCLFLYPREWGCITQLWAGLAPEAAEANGKVTFELSGDAPLPVLIPALMQQYVVPWGRIGKPHPGTGDVELAIKLWLCLFPAREALAMNLSFVTFKRPFRTSIGHLRRTARVLPLCRARRQVVQVMSSSSSSAILSDALSALSKTTHQVIADVEARSRAEVATARAETSEARNQLDKALKDLHAAQLEAEACRNETIAAKAQYAQAELTIAHHLETLGQHVETIAQLRREVNQWKDTSKTWQDHFSRVEKERVALSSRIDELQAERLLLTQNALTQAQNSIASTSRNSYLVESPTQASTSTQGQTTPHHQAPTNGATSRRTSGVKPPRSEPPKRPKVSSSVAVDSPLQTSSSKGSQLAAQRISQPHLTQQAQQEATERRKLERRQRKEEERQRELAAQQAQQAQGQREARQQPTPQSQPAVRQTTVIRRVQAVIHVKREEDSDDDPPLPKTPPPPPEESTSRSRVQHEQEQEMDHPQTEPKPRRRRMSRRIVEDDDYDESEDTAAVARRLRASRPIDYAESDVEEESDEDELMIGNEDDREGVYGSSKPSRRTKPRTSNVGPPSKKRKVSSRPQQ